MKHISEVLEEIVAEYEEALGLEEKKTASTGSRG